MSPMVRLATVMICLSVVGCGPVPGLIEQLEDRNVKVRRASASALSELGPEAREAVSALQKALGDEDREVVRLSAVALGNLRSDAQPAIPALAELLSDEQLAIRFSAALAIQKIDAQNDVFRSVLIEAMRTGEGGAIVAVGEMGPDAAWAVADLEALLKHPAPHVRLLAAQALGRIGPPAHNAESSLTRALSDQDEGVRAAARRAREAIRRTSNAQAHGT